MSGLVHLVMGHEPNTLHDCPACEGACEHPPAEGSSDWCVSCATINAQIATDPRYRAADGTPIFVGARLFNYYDCEWVVIEMGSIHDWANPRCDFHEHWDGWFHCRRESGGTVLLNGERLAGKEPAWYKGGSK